MNLRTETLKLFLFWLVAAAVGIVTYIVYIGPPGPQLIQIAILGALLALCIIFLLLRATKIGKNFATVLAVCWFIGTSALFSLMRSVDGRLLMLVLLAVGVSLNLALSVVLKRKALH